MCTGNIHIVFHLMADGRSDTVMRWFAEEMLGIR
jgi:hypothetical protein